MTAVRRGPANQCGSYNRRAMTDLLFFGAVGCRPRVQE
jgi:hypothetical protein